MGNAWQYLVTAAALSAAALSGLGCSVGYVPPAEEPAAITPTASTAPKAIAPLFVPPPAAKLSGPKLANATLRLGLAHAPLSLDPALALDHESIVVCENVFDTLVRFADGSFDLEPALAESWEFTKDELTWVFQLREGLKFQDGTPLTADAVAFSFHRQMDPESPYRPGACLYWARLMRAVREVRVLDSRRVAIELAHPYGPFLAALAMPQCGIVSPDAVKRLGAGFGRRPVGSGPFRVASWSQDSSVVLSANASYWGPKPSLAGAVIRAVPDAAARLLQLARGDLDAMEGISAADISFAESNGLKVDELPGLNVIYLAFNTRPVPATSSSETTSSASSEETTATTTPLAEAEPPAPEVSPLRERARSGVRSARIRKALARGVDKSAICSEVYGGLAVPAPDLLPPTLWGHNPELKDHAFEPLVGRQLLEQAGFATNFTFELLTLDQSRSYLPNPRKLAQAVRQQIEKLGVDVRVRVLDFDKLEELVQSADYEACLMGWTGDVGDPDNFLYTLLDPDNIQPPDSTNISFFGDEVLHHDLLEAQGKSSREARQQSYAKALAIVKDNAPVIPLVHMLDTLVTRKGKVAGLFLHPVGFRRLATASLGQ